MITEGRKTEYAHYEHNKCEYNGLLSTTHLFEQTDVNVFLQEAVKLAYGIKNILE